jgi:tRNA(fMet)-specific endonuclease VapC
MVLLDTNIIIKYIRQGLVVPDACFVSIVTIGEIKAFALKRNWGKQKLKILQTNLVKLPVLDIDDKITDIYAEIDAFSQGLLLEKKLNDSARNMGKNDLWIAATAYYFEIPLQTTDNDFDHLNDFGLKLDKVKF